MPAGVQDPPPFIPPPLPGKPLPQAPEAQLPSAGTQSPPGEILKARTRVRAVTPPAVAKPQ